MKYDAIVVGAGAGGGVIACKLAEAGKKVLLLEKGRQLSFAQVGRDHLKNQRLSRYGNNAGPDGHGQPRIFVDELAKTERTVDPWEGAYQNNASTVGGGTRVYGAQAWRFHPDDFRMASIYGVPTGSSLADWPISYDDLEPFYSEIERELGVAGDSHATKYCPTFSSDYPMAPMIVNAQGRVLRRGAKTLGWDVLPVPLAINTQPYQGRPACIHCQHCVGFACPVDAKNGTQNTYIPRATATGNCDLITEATVQSLAIDYGQVNGVYYMDSHDREVFVQADVVMVAAGAIETARLLLLSGFNNKTIGKNLQGHYYPTVTAIFENEVWDGVGPGPTTATTKFNHGNDGIFGGGMLADDFLPLPISVWKGMTPPGLKRWGSEPKRWMRDNYRYLAQVKGPVQEIPSLSSQVALDRVVNDRYNQPAARLMGTTHPETVRTAAFMFERAKEWALASGAREVWGGYAGVGLSAGQHQAGTCRMGEDPLTSVVDKNCRVHGQKHLYLGDGSVHVTNGGFNPFLTIMANAARTAKHILDTW